LRALPSFSAPAAPIEAAARAALDGESAPAPGVFALPVRRRAPWRWMAAAAVAIVVTASVVRFGPGERERDRHGELARAGVTEAEVEAARIEVEIAFGYVGKYSDRTARIVRDDVMEARVVPRVERAVREAGFDVTPRGRGRS
jgi:hypothetical protein